MKLVRVQHVLGMVPARSRVLSGHVIMERAIYQRKLLPVRRVVRLQRAAEIVIVHNPILVAHAWVHNTSIVQRKVIIATIVRFVIED